MTKPSPSAEAVTAWARLMRVSRQLLEETEHALKTAGLPQLAWYVLLTYAVAHGLR